MEINEQAFVRAIEGKFDISTPEILDHYDAIAFHYPEIDNRRITYQYPKSTVLSPRIPVRSLDLNLYNGCRSLAHLRIGYSQYVCRIKYYDGTGAMQTRR
jgi:hypothetical protein